MSAIKIKRVYEKVAKDEDRILGERLWPRGLAKKQAAINLWLKEMLVITNIFVFECDFLRIE